MNNTTDTNQASDVYATMSEFYNCEVCGRELPTTAKCNPQAHIGLATSTTNLTDTNQASELYELCKEVYKRTHWEDAPQFYDAFKDIYSEGEYEACGMPHSFIKGSYSIEDGQVPLYTSDYLLEKLPAYKTQLPDYEERLTLVKEAQKYNASYGYLYRVEADIPLLALLKLTIALSEAGELNG